VTTPPAGDDLGDFLERLGLPCERTYLGMLRVINARQLLAKVAPQVVVEEADDGADDGPVVLRAGAQRRVVGQRALVKLLLGPERIGSFGADALPFTFYQWPLDRV
jgi:hypothetical protein